MASRAGASTHLREEARRRTTGGINDFDDEKQSSGDEASGDESSDSLERGSQSPRYSSLVPSLLSRDEGDLPGFNIAPVNMTNEDGLNEAGKHPANPRGAPNAPSVRPKPPLGNNDHHASTSQTLFFVR